MKVNLEPFRLAEDWYKVPIAQSPTPIYVNIKQQVFSLAPVLHID